MSTKTPKAINIENETVKNIAELFSDLRCNVNIDKSKFLKNLDSVKGTLYNPITHDDIDIHKELQILTQATEITDPRFVIAKDIKKLHLEITDTPEKINVTNTSVIKNTDTNELDLKTFSYTYINAKNIPEVLKTKPVQFTPEENQKMLKNLENRLLDCPKIVKLPDTERLLEQVPPSDRKKSMMLINASMNISVLMKQDKSINPQTQTNFLRMTYVKPGKGNTLKDANEFLTRATFKNVLSASLLARELGENPPLKYMLRDPSFYQDLYETYIEPENGLKKLDEDIDKAKYTKSAMKIFILDKEKVRRSKEEIKTLEEVYKESPTGKELSPEDYYTYKKMDIEPFVIKMTNDRTFRTETDKEIEEKEKTFTEKMKSMGKMFNPHKIKETITKIVRSSIGKNARAETFRGRTLPGYTTVSRDMAKNAQKNKAHKKNRSRSTGRE